MQYNHGQSGSSGNGSGNGNSGNGNSGNTGGNNGKGNGSGSGKNLSSTADALSLLEELTGTADRTAAESTLDTSALLPEAGAVGDPDKAQESAWKELAETLDTSMLKTQDAAEEITDVTSYAPDVELPKAQIPSAGEDRKSVV